MWARASPVVSGVCRLMPVGSGTEGPSPVPGTWPWVMRAGAQSGRPGQERAGAGSSGLARWPGRGVLRFCTVSGEARLTLTEHISGCFFPIASRTEAPKARAQLFVPFSGWGD